MRQKERKKKEIKKLKKSDGEERGKEGLFLFDGPVVGCHTCWEGMESESIRGIKKGDYECSTAKYNSTILYITSLCTVQTHPPHHNPPLSTTS